jgi:SH3-like domain-containing protein
MRSGINLTKSIIIVLLLGSVWSCAKPELKPVAGPFYVTQQITYLLASPEYGAKVLNPLYRGDKVERLDGGESTWWRVVLLRSGQTGWVQKELLSPDPIAAVFYYVREESSPLLECPRNDCLPLQLLSRGDQVQKIKEGDVGWWRVMAVQSRSLGWMRAAVLTDSMEEVQQKQASKAYYYVAVLKLSLRAIPSNHAQIVRVLKFNDQVQKLAEVKGWLKVRQPSTGAVGWVRGRDLETFLLNSPRGVPFRDELKPLKQKEEPLWEPEFM